MREEGRKSESVLTKGGQNHLRNVIENNELIGYVNSPQHLQANQSKRMECLPNTKSFFGNKQNLFTFTANIAAFTSKYAITLHEVFKLFKLINFHANLTVTFYFIGWIT